MRRSRRRTSRRALAVSLMQATAAMSGPTGMARAVASPAIHIDIDSALGAPGDTVSISVSLDASGQSVAATANDIEFNKLVLDLDPASCRIASQLDQPLTVSVLAANSKSETLRVFVQAAPNANPIPDGLLYTCTFHIAPTALPGSYSLTNRHVMAFGPSGHKLAPVTGANGMVNVSLVIVATPTPTPTSSPTTTPEPTGTPTVTPTPVRCPPDLLLVPAAAPAGSKVQLSGRCAVAHTLQAKIFFDATLVATLAIGPAGPYGTTFSVPFSLAPGVHEVRVVAVDQLAGGTFEVTPTCLGDCNGDDRITVDELLTMLDIVLGKAPASACEAGDLNHDAQITIDEVLAAVNNALTRCPLG